MDEDFLQYQKNDLKIPTNSQFKWNVLFPGMYRDFLFNSRKLKGEIAFKMSLLEKIGFQPILVSYHE